MLFVSLSLVAVSLSISIIIVGQNIVLARVHWDKVLSFSKISNMTKNRLKYNVILKYRFAEKKTKNIILVLFLDACKRKSGDCFTPDILISLIKDRFEILQVLVLLNNIT